MAPLENLMGMGSLPALEIDLLRSFVLIADGDSFTRAAARVGRTQGAVSLQMQRLESSLGYRLFVRGKGTGVALTPRGARFLVRARELVALNDEIVASPGDGGDYEAAREPTAKPSIAVLPFQNISDDPGQNHFARGIVDDIITGLSRIRWLFVIARASSAAFDGKAFDVRQIGRELGVRYILQGSVRKAGTRVRIGAQLVEAASGTHLWADTYDGALDNLFDLQDRIADHVVGILEPSLRRSEIERSRRQSLNDLDAYDLYLRALPLVASHMPQETERALPLLEQALRREPDYAAAHALAAWCHEWRFTRAGFREADKRAALQHARAALASETDDAAALAMAGFAMTFLNEEHDEALAGIGRGVAANPSCATALYLSAHAHAIAGRSAPAKFFGERALLLSPFDPLAFEAHMALGETAVREEKYEDASACFARAVRANPKYSTAYFFRAMAQALTGHADGVGRWLHRGLELEPTFRCRMLFEIGMTPGLAEPLAEGGRLLNLRK